MTKLFVALLLAAPSLFAADEKPASLAAALQPFVESHSLAGAVALVASKGQSARGRDGRLRGHRRAKTDEAGHAVLDRLADEGDDRAAR